MVSIGVIGLGYWGPNIARNISSCPATSLGGLCDLDEARLAQIGEIYPAVDLFRKPTELLANPRIDAIAIATPASSHFHLAKEALEAGKHVLVEKPFTSSSIEAEELIYLAESRNRILMVNHVFLYSSAIRKLIELHRSGEFGEIQFIDSVRINLGLFQHDVNVMWDLLPHDLSIIDLLSRGRTAKGVTAVGSSHSGSGLIDVAYLHLDYGNDLLATIHVNWLSPVKIRHLLVGGSRRSALYNDLDASEPIKIYDRGIDVARDPEGRREVLISYRSGDVISPRVEKSEPLQNAVQHFANCIEMKIIPISSGYQGLRLLRILEAAEISVAKRGAYVSLIEG